MRLILRLALPMVAALAVSGCNMVVSREPWFLDADTNGSPQLRDGLWVRIDDSEPCRVKVSRPAHVWPQCAEPFLVRGREWLEPQWQQSDSANIRHRKLVEWKSTQPLLAAGDPPIIQIFEPGESENKAFHFYLGVRVLAKDEAGLAKSMALWLVQCGPMDEDAPSENTGEAIKPRYVTSRPFVGLSVVDDDCTAESVEALRNAARESEQLGPVDREGATRSLQWVRDTWP